MDPILHPMWHDAVTWAVRSGNTLTLVSANDHIHMDNSKHYQNMALDFHSSDMDGLDAHLRFSGYGTLWNVRGHYMHVHSEIITRQ